MRNKSRASLLLAGCALSALVAPRSFAQAIPPELRACVAETDDVRRLACYDREVARTSVPAQSAPEGGVRLPAQSPASAPEDRFGLRSPQRQQEAASARSIVAQVARVSERKSGGLTIELDNGQVWQQTESTTGFYVKAGDRVTVGSGALGAYWMSVESRPAARVRRVR